MLMQVKSGKRNLSARAAYRLAEAEQQAGLTPPASPYPKHREERVAGMGSAEVEEAARDLEQIREADPEAFETVRKVITTYHRTLKRGAASPKATRTSSVEAAAVAAINALADEVEAARHSPGADAPSHPASPPTTGARQPTERRRGVSNKRQR
ncbi:MAG: hypothetical protein JWR69_924 [Pedosphaera sp.]|nr:hypothetical protein [Pedosphaera sp.]